MTSIGFFIRYLITNLWLRIPWWHKNRQIHLHPGAIEYATGPGAIIQWELGSSHHQVVLPSAVISYNTVPVTITRGNRAIMWH